VFSDPQPMLRQLSLRECLAPGLRNTPEKPKRQYKPRGTCGTFGGQRPPKRAHLKAAFEDKRMSHEAHLQEKGKLMKDHAYKKFVKEMLPLETIGSARDRLRCVAEKWKSQTTSGEDAAALMAAENMAVM